MSAKPPTPEAFIAPNSAPVWRKTLHCHNNGVVTDVPAPLLAKYVHHNQPLKHAVHFYTYFSIWPLWLLEGNEYSQ